MIDKSGSDLPQHVYDVLIVGAGPVGLATAIGLHKRGITNILVIEQAREFRKVGQFVDLLPNGLRAVKYIDPEAYERIKETASKAFQPPGSNKSSGEADKVNPKQVPPKRIWRQINTQGEITRSFYTDFQSWFERYGEGRVTVSWFDLQTTLRSLLPPDKVQANHRCINVEEEAGRVRIDTISDAIESTNPFAHWEMMQLNGDASTSANEKQDSDRKSFYAKLVVGADGINSTIRKILCNRQELNKYSKAQYSGFSSLGSKIDNLPHSIREKLDERYIKGDRVVTIHNNSDKLTLQQSKLLRLMLINLPDNSITYLLYAPFDLNTWNNKSSSEILDVGKKALKNAEFPSIFTELLNSSSPQKLFNRLFYMHPVNIQNDSQLHWSKGRIVIVGDAAHAMPPFIAQGANQGFEDTAVIVTFITKMVQKNGLDQRSEIETIFEKYEKIRRPFMEKIQAATMQSNQWGQQQWDEFNEIVHRREYPSLITLE